MALNGDMRRSIGRKAGGMIKVKLTEDKEQFQINPDLLACIADEPRAKQYWQKLPPSHQRYYSKWIDSAKGVDTKVKRIAMAVDGMARGLNYGEMLRENRKIQ